jgi:hypothetical protein
MVGCDGEVEAVVWCGMRIILNTNGRVDLDLSLENCVGKLFIVCRRYRSFFILHKHLSMRSSSHSM